MTEQRYLHGVLQLGQGFPPPRKTMLESSLTPFAGQWVRGARTRTCSRIIGVYHPVALGRCMVGKTSLALVLVTWWGDLTHSANMLGACLPQECVYAQREGPDKTQPEGDEHILQCGRERTHRHHKGAFKIVGG